MKMVQLTEVVRTQGSGQGAQAPTFKKPERGFSCVGVMACPMPFFIRLASH